MNRIKFILLGIICWMGVNQSKAQSKEDYAQLTRKVSDWITSDQTDSIIPYFDTVMSRRLSASQISDLWQGLLMEYGSYTTKSKVNVEQRDVYLVATQVIGFSRMSFQLTVTYNPQMKIAGLYINMASSEYQVPDYVNTLSFVEYKIPFGKEPVLLDGMLTIKKTDRKLPLVIVLQGSGPQDIDGSYGSNKIYKDIAWGIASNEIAVFRYPKRTSIYGSLYLSGNTKIRYTLEDEYVNDLILAIEILCKRNDIDTSRIFLFGHSQGGDAAILAAQKTGRIKGIVMASTSPRKIQELMCEQLDYINGYEPVYAIKRIKGEEMKQKLVYSLRPDLKETDPFDSLPLNIAPSYWMFLNNFNLVDSLKSMPSMNLLFLQGGRDYQVTTVDFNLWKEAFSKDSLATFRLYPKLNHMYYRGEARSTAAEYDEVHHVDGEIVTDVVRWIKKIAQ